MASLYLAGGFDFFERELAELRFRLFERPATDSLVVVAIDAPSLRELRTWPWPRDTHARVIERLLAAGADQIAFDVDFSSPSTPDMDARFEAALDAAAGRVILPVFQQRQRGSTGPDLILTEPIPEFRARARVASITVLPGDDGLVWQMETRRPWANGSLPTLSALLAEREAAGIESFNIDFSINPETIPQLSFADVLAGRFDSGVVRGKKVLIGATAAELQDNMPVPVYRSVSGVLLHALAYQSLVQGRALKKVGAGPILLFSALIALVLGRRFIVWSSRRGFLTVVAAIVALLIGSTGAQILWPLSIDTTPLIGLFLLLYILGVASRIDRQALRLLYQTLRLRRVDALMGNVVENSFDGILTIRSDGIVETANRAACEIFEYTTVPLTGVHLRHLVPDLVADDGERKGLDISPGQRETQGRRLGGSTFPAEIAVSETKLGDERLFIAVVRDVTERKVYQTQLEHQALHDALTGLPNRTLLRDRLEHAVDLAWRSEQPMALLLLDLDRFKTINDTLGHHVGDLLLRDVAARLAAAMRRSDTVVRLGGDEFAMLLPAVTELARAKEVSRRILASLTDPFQVEGLSLEVGASIGIAMFPEHAQDPDALLQCADVAMYAAKEEGSDIAVYDQGRDQNSVRYLTLTGELRQAIEHNQLSLHFQPKIDLNTMRVVGAEALSRWHHPDHGFIPPDEFILHAEQTGLIGPLTHWVFATALSQLKDWQDRGHDLSMAINISARNLHDEGLPDLIARLVSDWQVDLDRLVLEITESAIMSDPEASLRVVKRLHSLGVRLAVDDFGTGHSSLSYLKSLTLDELKIDKSFVMHMEEDDNDAVIVRSTIDLAHNLGLKVVAEGIECAQHARILKSLGCDVGQGYWISRPLSAEDFDAWLEGAGSKPLSLESPQVPASDDASPCAGQSAQAS